MFPLQAPAPTLSVTAPDIILMMITIIIAMLIAVTGYRAMQRPRIVLTQMPEGQWRAGRRDVIQYLVSIPFLLFAWDLFLILILISGNNSLTGTGSLIVATSVIAAARILAHLSPERSHELAKSVPLTLVTLLLISGGIRKPGDLVANLQQWLDSDVSGPAQAVLLVVELATSAIWYWVGVRYLWQRGYRVPGMPVPPNARRPSRTTNLE